MRFVYNHFKMPQNDFSKRSDVVCFREKIFQRELTETLPINFNWTEYNSRISIQAHKKTNLPNQRSKSRISLNQMQFGVTVRYAASTFISARIAV